MADGNRQLRLVCQILQFQLPQPAAKGIVLDFIDKLKLQAKLNFRKVNFSANLDVEPTGMTDVTGGFGSIGNWGSLASYSGINAESFDVKGTRDDGSSIEYGYSQISLTTDILVGKLKITKYIKLLELFRELKLTTVTGTIYCQPGDQMGPYQTELEAIIAANNTNGGIIRDGVDNMYNGMVCPRH